MTDTNDTRVLCKIVNDVEIYVEPRTGVFSATFSQSAEPKKFERPTLLGLEELILQHTAGFTGHVEYSTRPGNPIRDYDIQRMRDRWKERVRRNHVVTGVHKVTRPDWRGPGVTLFRNPSSRPVEIDSDDVWPDAELDGQMYDLNQEHIQVETEFMQRYQAIIDQYEGITAADVVRKLREQGARTGRAAS